MTAVRILLIEDEPSYSEPLTYVLRKEGYAVTVAETGPDGLDAFDKSGADLVLLDAAWMKGACDSVSRSSNCSSS